MLGVGSGRPDRCDDQCNGNPNNVCDFCGGFAGFPCDDGYKCIDDPCDDCDPLKGGADCGGICIECPDSLSACFLNYAPVCCGGSTYSNQCFATLACRTRCSAGPC